MAQSGESDWKLKLRYGQLKTPFSHYTLIADGVVEVPNEEYGTSTGPAIMSMRVWVESEEEAFDMVATIGRHLGFSVQGKTKVYVTPPEQPPTDKAFGYDIKFIPYAE